MDLNDLVEVFSTTHEVEAEVVRSALEAEGIQSQISGKNQGSFAGVLDVKVYVKAADAVAAQRFIAEHNQHKHPG